MRSNNDGELSYVQYVIAGELDQPSVYLTGPSPTSMRTAKRVIESLQASGIVFVFSSAADETKPQVNPYDGGHDAP